VKVLLLLPVILFIAGASDANAAAAPILSYNTSQNRGYPGILVSGAAPGARLELFDGVTPLATLASGRSGQASFSLQGLAPGVHTLFAKTRGASAQATAALQVAIPQAVTGRFPETTGLALGIQPSAFAAGDLNRDGAADFVAAGNGTVSVVRGGSNPPSPAIFTGISNPTAVLIADFDGDGWNDVAVSSSSGQVAILLNDGAGGLTAPYIYNVGAHPSALAVADFNGDGILDLAVANEAGNDVSLLIGRTDGTFESAQHFNAGLGPRSLVAADFNGDGFADLAVADFAGNGVTVLLGDGTGALHNAGTISTGNGPSSLVSGDFNEDGATDLAVLNQLDRSVALLLGNNQGQFGLTATLNNVTSFAAGHILGGNHLDLAIQNGSELTILAGAGNGTFKPGPGLGNSAAPQSILLADFNGDGLLDAGAADLSGVLSMFLAAGAPSAASAPVPTQLLTAAVSAQPESRKLHALVNGTTPSGVTLSSSKPASNLGQAVTLTATLNSQTATGKVTFFSGTTIIGIQPLSQGQSQLTTALLPSGANSLTARYSGDSTYASSLSSPVVQTVSVLPQSGFQSSGAYGTQATPYIVVTADFDGNGTPDVAVTDNAGGNITVFLNNGHGGFTTPGKSYSAGSQPYGLVAVDVDGDGIMDLVATNANAATVTVLLGSGTGSFSIASSPSVGTTPQSIAAGDFNGDGIADLVVANQGSGNVSVLLGNGDGTFQTAVPYSVGTNPTSVAIADFNADGFADIVTANNGSSNLSVLLGNGDGTFNTATPYSAGSQPISVAATDLNADGYPDLVVANSLNSGQNVRVLLNNKSGGFATAVPYAAGVSPHFVTTGDFNADGIPDLVVINKGSPSTFSVFYGSGGGAFAAAVTTAAGSSPWSAAVADFNGDGRSDLVLSSSANNDLFLLLGLGQYPDLTVASTHAANFTQGQSGATYTLTVTNGGPVTSSGIVSVIDTLPAGLTATAIAGGTGSSWNCSLLTLTCSRSDSLGAGLSYDPITVTVNVANNAALTVTNSVTVSGGGEINTGNDSGTDPTTVLQKTTLTLTSSANPSVTGASVALTATVSNTAATGTVVFYEGGTPIAAEPVSAGQAVFNTSLLASGTHVLNARYNGDIQYLTSTSASIVQTVNNNPQNGFQSGVNYALGAVNPSAVTVADFNGDGWPDIAVANSSGTNRVMVLLNKGGGTGTFNGALTNAGGGTNSAPYSIVAADFNGDGIMDVAVANNGTNNVSVLTGTGNGTFAVAKNTPAGSHPQYLVAGDFNNDGLVDLAVANYGTSTIAGNVGVLLGNGDGTFQTMSTLTVGTNPRALILGDFNGDGISDLAVANYSSGTISVLIGAGNGAFQPAVTYSVGSNPQALALGDFNSDGVIDIAVGNGGSNSITIWFGKGDGTFPTSGTVAAGGSPTGLVAADFSGDGVLDIGVTTTTAGVSMLLGVGNGTFQSPLYYTVGNSPSALASADFDGDGTSDLAVANQASSNVTVLLGGLFYSDPTIFASHTGNFTQGQVGATYTLTVYNVGSYPTSGTVTVTDTLPSGVAATAIAGTNWNCNKNTLTCTRTDALAPGNGYPAITVTVNVAANAAPSITNKGTVSGGHENNSTNDSATDPTTVIQTTTTNLSSSDPGWVYKESITLTATVSAAAATGTVTFYQGSTALSTVPVSNGTASIPGPSLTPGNYTFTATYSGDSVYGGSTGTLVQTVGKATATVTLGNLSATWTGNPVPASVSTNPNNLTVNVTYNGSPTAPSNVGTYPVVATVNDPNYTGTASGNLVISPIQATVNLTAPTVTYDGNPHGATATTTPSGLTVSITYGGNSTAPTSAGSYNIVATVTTPNYSGSATGTLVINPAPVTITLSGFSATYDGTPKAVNVSTNPTNIGVTVTYNGSTTAPTGAGTYAVSASPSSSNYSGSASGTLIVSPLAASVVLGNLTPTYDGTAKPVSVTVTPTVAYSVRYNGAFNPPTVAGSYNVVATVTDPNYTGSATGTLVIQKATPVVTWAQPAPIMFGSALGPNQLNASAPANGTIAYSPGAGTVLLPGANQTLSATFSPNDPANYNTVTATTTITVTTKTIQGVDIILTRTLTRDGSGNVVVNITLANAGNADAQNVTLTTAKIGSTSGAPLPIGVGAIPAGSVAVVGAVTIPGSVGPSGTLVTLTLGGTYTGGSFSAGGRVFLP
jgi:hypothetical protein